MGLGSNTWPFLFIVNFLKFNNYIRMNSEKTKAYQKAYYKKNREKLDAQRSNYIKEYRLKNRDKSRAAVKKYTDSNKELVKERQKVWRANNPDKIKEARKRNRKAVYAKNARRRSDKLNQTPKWADLRAITEFYKNCPEGYHVDHIIPLKGAEVRGLHVLENLQYLPALENIKKGNRV